MRFVGPNIITNNLIYYFDAANPKSYVSGSAVCSNLLPTPISGALLNGPIFSSSSKGILTFNGTDEYILLESSSILNIPSGSLEIWCRTNDPTSSLAQHFISRNNQSGGTFNILKNVNSTYSGWYFRFRAGGIQVAATSSKIANSEWTHLVGTFTNSTGSLYVNGILDGFVYQSGDIDTTSYASMTIGSNAGTTGYASGSVALAKIYNRALTSDEVLKNYNATKDRFI